MVGIKADPQLVVGTDEAQNILRRVAKTGSGKILHGNDRTLLVGDLRQTVQAFHGIEHALLPILGGNRLAAGMDHKFINAGIGGFFDQLREKRYCVLADRRIKRGGIDLTEGEEGQMVTSK